MASLGQGGPPGPPVIVDGRDGAPPAVGVIQVVVDVDPEYRKKAQKVTQKALYLLKYFTSLMSPIEAGLSSKIAVMPPESI